MQHFIDKFVTLNWMALQNIAIETLNDCFLYSTPSSGLSKIFVGSPTLL